MAEQPKAQPAAEQKTPDPNAEIARLRKENADLKAQVEASEREAGIMRSALDQAREEGKIGLPKTAAQLSEPLTVVVIEKDKTKLVDAKPGDVLAPAGSNLDPIKRHLPAGVRLHTVSAETIAEARERKLTRQ